MNRGLGALFAVSILAFTAGSSEAHHSFAVNYDTGGAVAEIHGVISSVRIRNPHSIFEVDVEADNGAIEQWVVETHAVPLLARIGLYRDTFVAGETVTVRGMPSRFPGRKLLFGVSFVKADGTAYVWLPTELVPDGGLSASEERSSRSGLQRFEGVWGYEADPNPHIFADSPLPLTQAALDLRETFDPFDTSAMRCIPPNLPGILYVPYLYGLQIEDGTLRLQHEYFSITRTVSLDGGPTPAESSAMFGETRGRIEGNAIVIESSGFPDLEAGMATAFDPNGLGADVPSSNQKRFTERYTVNDDGTILTVDYTIEDSRYLTDTYDGRTQWSRLADDTSIEPFECDPAMAAQSSEQADPE